MKRGPQPGAVADLLGIRFDRWMQVRVFPVTRTVGTDFRITLRQPGVEPMRWNSYAGD